MVEKVGYWFNVAAMMVWLLITPIALIWWKESIVFLVFASLWANVAAHLSALLAAHSPD